MLWLLCASAVAVVCRRCGRSIPGPVDRVHWPSARPGLNASFARCGNPRACAALLLPENGGLAAARDLLALAHVRP
eukprot:12598055-Alexandrium_andersonii.AAC.1